MKRSFVILLVLVVGVVLTASSQTRLRHPVSDEEKAIDICVKEFLAGKDCDDVLAYVSGGVFQEEAPSPRAIRERYKNCELIFLKGVTMNNGTAAMFVKTKMRRGPDQLHTFFLQLNRDKQWRVKGWHTSHS